MNLPLQRGGMMISAWLLVGWRLVAVWGAPALGLHGTNIFSNPRKMPSSLLKSQRWWHLHWIEDAWDKDFHPRLMIPRYCVDQPRPPLHRPFKGVALPLSKGVPKIAKSSWRHHSKRRLKPIVGIVLIILFGLKYLQHILRRKAPCAVYRSNCLTGTRWWLHKG